MKKMSKEKELQVQEIYCYSCAVSLLNVIGIIGNSILLKCSSCGTLQFINLDKKIPETKPVKKENRSYFG